MSPYRGLAHFLSCTFHQDWNLDASTWQEAVRNYQRLEGPEASAVAAKELRALLRDVLDDAVLDARVDDLGSYFYPQSDSLTTRAWLHKVLAVLESDPEGAA